MKISNDEENHGKSEIFFELLKKLFHLDPQMRFASIIDLKGNIVEGIMKTGKNSHWNHKDKKSISVNKYHKDVK